MTVPLVLVVGEFADRALTARTLRSLAIQGIAAQVYEFKFGRDRRPLTYAGVLARLLRAAGPGRLALVIPAGQIAGPGFAAALQDFLRGETVRRRRRGWRSRSVAGVARETLLCRGLSRRDRRVRCCAIGEGLAQALRSVPEQRRLRPERPFGSFKTGRVFPRVAGETTFQAVQGMAGDPVDLEAGIKVLEAADFAALEPGWVYRCNNEPVRIAIDYARECDTLVAVAAGIKPWNLANALRGSIKRLIIVDASPAQLRFAYDVFTSIPKVESWDSIWNLPGYTSEQDDEFRATHNEVFDTLKAGHKDWRFEVVFVHGDIITQTFRLLELMRRLGVERPMIWCSNIFQPYLGKVWSEHHEGLEYSFVTLMRQTFPDVVVFNSGEYPLDDPRRTLWPAHVAAHPGPLGRVAAGVRAWLRPARRRPSRRHPVHR